MSSTEVKQTFPHIEQLIPHRLPMRLIDALVSWTEEHATCTATIHEHTPFLSLHNNQKQVSSLISLEYFAQTAAAWFGYRAFRNQLPFTLGVLCGTRMLCLELPYFDLGDSFTCHATNIWSDSQTARFRCVLQRRSATVARAIISVMHDPLPFRAPQ